VVHGRDIALCLPAGATAAESRVSTTSQRHTRYDRHQRMEWPQRRTTQRSDAIHLAIRQVSARQEAPVGGDWCDAFVHNEGHTLVIGDVAGHDATAARAMIRLRRLLRRVAADATHGAGPAELLTAVDKAMTTQGVGILTTGIVARLTRLPDAHAWLLRWSNAGHPPPVLVDGDGLVSTLVTPPDRPLGIGSDRPRSEAELVLQPGTTLILFTDGLVERRRQVVDDGIRSLSTALTDLGPPALRDPESLCGELFARLLPDWPEDDVAILVAHLTTPTDLAIGRPVPAPGALAG
jgi:two-component system, chemotaxis family, sensor kinase Cph1